MKGGESAFPQAMLEEKDDAQGEHFARGRSESVLDPVEDRGEIVRASGRVEIAENGQAVLFVNHVIHGKGGGDS